jgi:hypothetical protein
MKRSVGPSQLLRALQQILPDAELSVIHERRWHSLTFSGVQICIAGILCGCDHVDTATRLAQILPEHEFDVKGQLVADIAVVKTVSGTTQSRLMIDALLLDD